MKRDAAVKRSAFSPPPTAQSAVLEELRRMILARELRPGAQIRADAIAEQLGVSRVPVREALRMLEGEGQVTYTPHHGYFVTELRFEDLVEIYRIREVLEAEAVKNAVDRLEEEDLDRLRDAMDEMENADEAGDIMAHTIANRRFHFALFEPSEMPHLLRYIRMLWDSSDPYRSLYYNDAENRRTVRHEHHAIFKAADERDLEPLLRLLSEHRQRAIGALRMLLVEDEQRQASA